jgi:hypothetical protein
MCAGVGVCPQSLTRVRAVIEAKILQHYFHSVHNVPEAVSFSRYIHHSFKVSAGSCVYVCVVLYTYIYMCVCVFMCASCSYNCL